MVARPGFVNRDDLISWAKTPVAKSEFPRLMRRLIMETAPSLARLGFTAGSGTSLGGWDGTVRANKGNAFVPAGLSVWELSVGADVTNKPDEDYSKRTSTPDGSPTSDCTYIEAILRPWGKRDEWASLKESDGRWSEVRAYGVDAVETWLEGAPVTHAWISDQLGLGPYGYRAVETWWAQWSSATHPRMTHDTVLAGRDVARDQVRSFLTGAPGVMTVSAESEEEVLAFVASVLTGLAADGDAQVLARAAFVDDVSSWRALSSRAQPLVLVPIGGEVASEVPINSRQHVLVPLPAESRADVAIPALDPSAAKTALVAAGMGDDHEAERAARLGRRSLLALRRHLALKPELHTPPWAKSPSRSMRGILLAGAWHGRFSGDKEILTLLTGEDYDQQLVETLSALSIASDPFVARLDDVWMLVSAEDAWLQLVSALRADDLERFISAAKRALLEIDPLQSVPTAERWRAGLNAPTRTFSPSIRRAFAATLALLGVHGERVSLSRGSDGAGFVAALVTEVLQAANADNTGMLWRSLADLLPRFAEAAPDAFLDAVRTSQQGENPLAVTLFEDLQSDQFGNSSSAHTGLLWALERLAWSADHFGQVVQALARLAELDPGGKLSNRPIGTLLEVLCAWHPQTSANTASRLSAIDSMRRLHPSVAWRVMQGLLPKGHDTVMSTAAPEFREWKDHAASPFTVPEYLRFINELVQRLIADAGTEPDRWSDVFQHLTWLPPGDRAELLSHFAELIESNQLAADGRAELWESLRSEVAKHRALREAQWALPEVDLAALDVVIDALTPTDPVTVNGWLFTTMYPHTQISSPRQDDFPAYESQLHQLRVGAIGDIDARLGLPGIQRLAGLAANIGGIVGAAAADATGDKYRAEVLATLGDQAQIADASIAWGWTVRRIEVDGWPAVEDLLETVTSPVQQAAVLQAARDHTRAIERLSDLPPDVEDAYWTRFNIYGLGEFESVELASRQLVKCGRVSAALKLTVIYGTGRIKSSVDHVLWILDEFLKGYETDQEREGIDQWDFTRLFEYLHGEAPAERTLEIAKLEWAYLPSLGFDHPVEALQAALADDPAFLVQLLKLAFRAKPLSSEPEDLDDAEPNDRSADLASNAYRLLQAFKRVPGGRDDGTVDGSLLREWIDAVLDLARDAGRGDIAEEIVGSVLSNAPSDKDGTWPCSPVREVFEELQSQHLEVGFEIAVFNRRGVTTRGLEDGGAQEVALATHYRDLAKQVADGWPRTASMLRRLATSYNTDARREEGQAERFRQGLT